MIDLKGKNILITGASSGIGRACALKCNEAGATVHLMGRNISNLMEVYTQLQGENNSYHVLDMRDTEQFPQVIEQIVKEHGKIGGFIHSAGYQITAPLSVMKPEQYHDIFLVNTISALEFSRIIAQKKNHDESGLSIIFIAGGISVIGVPALIAYAASKAALVGAAKAIALEFAPRKNRVNCVSPGYITDTRMLGDLDSILSQNELQNLDKGYPLGLGKTIDISSMCAYLLSDQAHWITGQNIIVDGGATAR